MKPISSAPVLLALALLAAACTPPGTTADRKSDDPKTPSNGATPGESASKTPDISTVPADLKHDAYSYNGFGRTKAVTYLFTKVQGDKPEEGTQSAELKEVKDGAAAFTVNRTGSLEAIGREDLLVKKDGVYLVSTSLGSPKDPVMLMPATIKPGSVWDYSYELTTSSGDKMSFKGKARAMQMEKVTVKAGAFDTLLVNETAEMNRGGVKGTVSSKTWYAKDVGVVKMKMEVKDSGGKIVTSTIELSNTGG